MLAPEIAELAGALAAALRRHRSDVLRLAVPPRHATDREGSRLPADAGELDAAAASDRRVGRLRRGAAFLAPPRRGGVAAGGLDGGARRRTGRAAARARRGRHLAPAAGR